MRKGVRGALALTAVVAATGMAGTATASASAEPTGPTATAVQESDKVEAKGDPCGWFSNPGAYYNHCGTGNVIIYVDRWNIGGVSDYEQCVGPGTTYLGGGWPDWQGAWYTGKTC